MPGLKSCSGLCQSVFHVSVSPRPFSHVMMSLKRMLHRAALGHHPATPDSMVSWKRWSMGQKTHGESNVCPTRGSWEMVGQISFCFPGSAPFFNWDGGENLVFLSTPCCVCWSLFLACKNNNWPPQIPAFFLSSGKVGDSISPVLPLFPWLLLGLSMYKSFACFRFSAQQLCFKGTSCLIATYWILLSDCCKFSKIELGGLRGLVPGRTTAEYFSKASVF